MSIVKTDSTNSMGKTQIDETTDSLTNGYASLSKGPSTGRKDSPVRGYAARTAANLRSIVERRFMRMSETHDRIRTELLASHSADLK